MYIITKTKKNKLKVNLNLEINKKRNSFLYAFEFKKSLIGDSTVI